MVSEELRFVNNLAIILECGRPMLASLEHLREDCRDPECRVAYQAMVEHTERGGHFTDVLGDYPQLCSRTALALLRAGRRSGCLRQLASKLATLVRAKVDGEWDPRTRFLETWALMVESGIPLEEALSELARDFARGPLGEVAEGLRAAVVGGRKLADGAARFPDVFNAVSRDLLGYGEARDLASALRAITRLL